MKAPDTAENRVPSLPAKWKSDTLQQLSLVPVLYGILQPGPDTPGGIPYVRPTEISEDVIDLSSIRRTTPEIAGKYKRSVLKPDDIILSIVGTTGKVAIVPTELDGGNITQSSVRIRVKPEQTTHRYIAWALRSPVLTRQYDKHRLGTAVPRLNVAHVRALEIPVAPLPEQRRIVAEIEKQFTRLEAGGAALRRVQANLHRYRAAVLKAACEGRLVPTEAETRKKFETGEQLLERILKQRREQWTGKGKYKDPATPDITGLPKLPDGWCWTRLEQLGFPVGGLTKNPKRAKLPKQLPYLRVANVYANELRLDEIEHIGVDDSELEKLLLRVGDLLVVEGNGSKDQIGRLAVWDGSIDPCVHQNHIIKVRPIEARMPKWILHWVQSPGGRHFVELVASSTSGLYTLSVGKVGDLPIALPPLAEQERIVAEVERRLSVVEESSALVTANLQRATRLRQSILQRAFEGKLVGQA